MSLTSFIGREELALTVEDLLREGDVRLLTLSGPGGVGKTRLALHIAANMAGVYADGVGYFPLADVLDPALVMPAIALQMGIWEGDRRSLLERVAAHLGSSRSLLVLDNFEQVAAAAPVLTDLLRLCPDIAILVTSRRPLHVSGEHVFPIPPLSVPSQDIDADAVNAESVRLFLARAEAVHPGITATEETTQVIAEICRRLDGLPLAIELAAARTALLPLPVMLERLTRRLQLLANGPRDQPARLQTMYSAIAWSYDLLAPAEQALFRQLSALAGRFSLSAAVAVAGKTEEVVFASLEGLVDQSLVRAVIEPVTEPRFTMLETIREFGLEQLAGTGEESRVRERHAHHFLEVVESIGDKVDGPEANAWLIRLDLDRPNVQAALSWLVRHRKTDGALRTGSAMWRYWRIRGYLSEGREWLRRALDLTGDVPGQVRADALWKLGYLEFYLGEGVPAREHLEQSIALFETAGDLQGVATATDALGAVLRFERDMTHAAARHQRALALRRELGDSFGQAMPLASLGILALDRGALDEARVLLEEALALTRAHGSPREIAYRVLNLAQLELASNQLDRARSFTTQSANAFETIGDSIATSTAQEVLGRIEMAAGNREQAGKHFLESLHLRLQLGLRRDLDELVERLAAVVLVRDPDLAVRMLSAAETDRATTGHSRLDDDDVASRSVTAATQVIGQAAFEAAWEEGRHLSLIAAGQAAQACLAAAEPHLEPAGEPGSVEEPVEPIMSLLSARELEVLRLVAAGHTNRVIAATLFISPATVKRHVTNILAKLELPTRAAAISFALRSGLIPD